MRGEQVYRGNEGQRRALDITDREGNTLALISVRPLSSIAPYLILVVQEDLEGLRAVHLAARPLPHDLGGVDQVLQDRVLYRRQCARPGSGSLGLGGTSVRLAQDGALRDHHHVRAAGGREGGRG